MSGDEAIKRAAGVMCWHLHRGGSEEGAIAKASKREPQLSERELAAALQWARDSLAFCDALNMALEVSENGCSLCDDLPPPGECDKCAEFDISELASRYNLPREE